MNQQKIEDAVSHIDYLISELKHLKSKLTIEEGLHFNVYLSQDMFVIEQWDSDLLEPRILCNKKSVSEEEAVKECLKALNTLGIRAYKKQIYWNSDVAWDVLPENFRKLDMVYRIEKRKLTLDSKQDIRERLNALYNVQG